MDHVGIVVDDLPAATEFFVELGLKLQGEGQVGGDWVDRVVGLEGVQAEIAMIETPDGHARIELVKFRSPQAQGDQGAPSNTYGLRHISFLVEDLDAVLAGLQARGVELIGEVERYEDIYRVCYVSGRRGSSSSSRRRSANRSGHVPSRLALTREQILAFRRRVGALEERLPKSAKSLRIAAWAGLQDSMPRAALLSLHARVAGVGPATWKDPSLVQLWGPRYNTYVVPKRDFALFSVGRLPEDDKGRERAERMAALLRERLAGARATDRELGPAAGVHPNAFRYAGTTGTVAIRWEGARAPIVWNVPPPAMAPDDARCELARRYLHVFGPATAEGFARWAGISRRSAAGAFESLDESLLPVRTPLGDELLLAEDEPAMRAPATAPAPARLLPSGDAYWLLDGRERELLVPRKDLREQLWTPRVWPGALLVEGEVRGTWRRAQHAVRIEAWERLSRGRREAVEAEAGALPLPGLDRDIEVFWGY